MFAVFRGLRNPARAMGLGLVATFALVACDTIPRLSGPASPRVDPSAPVPVAMLVPQSAGAGGSIVARSIENAARLAIADLQGAEIDLRVYDTAGEAGTAAEAARRAIADGARVIVGPLYTQTTTAIVPEVAGRDISVLSFSNNTDVAGGNVFILGQTFDNVANRLTAYASREGRNSVAVVHSSDLAGNAGRDAIIGAANRAGLSIATVQSYPLSSQGITEAGPRIADAIEQTGADTVFLTANVDTDLPLIATTLPDNGVSPAQVRYLGLTRWNAAPEALSLPGLQGGIFTLPDQSVLAQFESRYQAAYGEAPHPLAGLGYDAIQTVGSLVAGGRADALSASALTQSSGFAGAYGVFRLLPDGTNQRALAVAQIQNNQVVVVDPAPRRFGGSLF